MMLRSVNKYAVEINHPNSEYFERILCFVRPQYAENGTVDLHRAAEECIDGIEAQLKGCGESGAEPKRNIFFAAPKWALMSVSGALGCLLTVIGFLLII